MRNVPESRPPLRITALVLAEGLARIRKRMQTATEPIDASCGDVLRSPLLQRSMMRHLMPSRGHGLVPAAPGPFRHNPVRLGLRQTGSDGDS
jgi:hypothetical protein